MQQTGSTASTCECRDDPTRQGGDHPRFLPPTGPAVTLLEEVKAAVGDGCLGDDGQEAGAQACRARGREKKGRKRGKEGGNESRGG